MNSTLIDSALISLGVFIGLTISYLCYKNFRVSDAYQYMPLEKSLKVEIDSASAAEAERRNQSRGRVAANICRSTLSMKWKDTPLLGIGFRNSRTSFLIDFQSSPALLTLTCPSSKCRLPLRTESVRNSLKAIFSSISQHPLIDTVLFLDYMSSPDLLITATPFAEKGSIRDVIHGKVSPRLPYVSKYTRSGTPFHVSRIGKYGRQILEAVRFLRGVGFSSLNGHLHSGNVLLDSSTGTVRLANLENLFLACKPRYASLLFRTIEYHTSKLSSPSSSTPSDGRTDSFSSDSLSSSYGSVASTIGYYDGGMSFGGGYVPSSSAPLPFDMDVLCIGRCLYEMALGFELDSPAPHEHDYRKLAKPLASILRVIFTPRSPPVTLEELFEHPFFRDMDVAFSIPPVQCNLDDTARLLITEATNQRDLSKHTKVKKSKKEDLKKEKEKDRSGGGSGSGGAGGETIRRPSSVIATVVSTAAADRRNLRLKPVGENHV